MKAQSLLLSEFEVSYLIDLLTTQSRGLQAMSVMNEGLPPSGVSALEATQSLLRKLGIEAAAPTVVNAQALSIIDPGPLPDFSEILKNMSGELSGRLRTIPNQPERIA